MTPPLVSWAGLILVALLIAAAATDLKYGKIYNVVTYPAVAVGLIGHTLCGGLTGDDARWMGLTGALAGLAAGFLPLLAAWKAGGIGGGDAKVMAAIGALMGWRFALATLFYGLIVAAIMAFAVMIRRRIVWATLKRLGRFLYLVLTPTKPAAPVTQDSPKIAFGLALCFGAAAAVVEAMIRGGMTPGRILGF